MEGNSNISGYTVETELWEKKLENKNTNGGNFFSISDYYNLCGGISDRMKR